MTLSQQQFMKHALELSKQSLPRCLPNPPVGCVIVKEQKIIAEGYTQEPGNFHAEAMALNLCETDTTNSDIYVTLEPCSFFGRTPACAKAIVEAKIKRAYVAILDPDPRNNGKGIAILEEAGIEVSIGLLKQEVEAFIGGYLLK